MQYIEQKLPLFLFLIEYFLFKVFINNFNFEVLRRVSSPKREREKQTLVSDRITNIKQIASPSLQTDCNDNNINELRQDGGIN